MSDNQAPAGYPAFYFDMDGVLCAYSYSDYKPGPDGLAPYQRHGVHIFRDIPENPSVMQAFRLMYGLVPKGCCRVLTRIPVGITQAEHTIDKFNWVKARMSNFRQEDFLCVSVPKHNAVGDTMVPLGPHIVLVDDWNPNLQDWKDHGGTPVKMLNGINSPNRQFVNVSAGWKPQGIMNAILQAGYSPAAQG